MSDIYMMAQKFLSEHFTSAPLSASNIIFHGHALENLKCHLIDLNGKERQRPQSREEREIYLFKSMGFQNLFGSKLILAGKHVFDRLNGAVVLYHYLCLIDGITCGSNIVRSY